MKDLQITKVASNAMILTMEGVDHIVSYESVTASVKNGEIIALGSAWDYSVTTAKHFNMCLRELGLVELASMPKAKKETYFKERGLI